MKHFLLVCVLATFIGCSGSSSRFKGSYYDDFEVFRDYRLATEDTDPQPAWALNDYRIVVRSKRGLGILNEGPGKQKFYNNKDASRIGWPTWIDEDRIIVGSPEFMTKTEEGEITQSNVVLRMIKADGLKLEEDGFVGDINAYFTRAHDRMTIFAQKGESIISLSPHGAWEEYDQGFFAQPQRGGSGVCFTTVPIIEKDYWTGKTGNGKLIVRWAPGRVDIFPNCFQPQWCADGGIVATRLKGEIKANKNWDWTLLDSDVVYIKAGSKEVRVVREHAHSPAPNPKCNVVACVGRAGHLYLDNLDKDGGTELVPEGNKPQWSYDGERLLTEVPGLDDTTNLRVWVFRNKNEVTQESTAKLK